MVNRHYNFSAGPSTLPQEVLEQAQRELVDWQGKGVSVMEISHRSDDFMQVLTETEKDLRTLLAIPSNYHVLFLQGGATAQFAAVPLNLIQCSVQVSADYMVTGVWSEKAYKEASRFGKINRVLTGDYRDYKFIPDPEQWAINPKSAYLHYCHNETISGLMFNSIPDVSELPVVADLSSIILAQAFDVKRFGLIYAGAQKNIGPAGVTLVIVRDDLLDYAAWQTPNILNYQQQAANRSMLNTPPTFIIYLAGLIFKWLLKQGGVSHIESINKQKAATLYNYIDQSALYRNPIEPNYRSITNITFRLTQPELETDFLHTAKAHNLLYLKGHKSQGGIRASMYNAMPLDAAHRLVEFMRTFEASHRKKI